MRETPSNERNDRLPLPDGWTRSTIGACCLVNRRDAGIQMLPDELPVSFVPMAAVDADLGTIANPVNRPLGEVRRGFTAFGEGDVIFARITPSMENGKAAIATGLTNGLGFGSTEFHVMRPGEAITPKWLFYFIRQNSFREEAKANFTGTAGQLRVPDRFIRNAQIPLPPITEQERIVAKLEALHQQSRAARQALDRIPALLRDFRRAVLEAAFRGELSERHPGDEPAQMLLERIRSERRRKWEENLRAKGKDPANYRYEEPTSPDISILPELPEGWVWARFEELLAELKNGHFSKAPSQDPPGIPILRINAVRPFSVNLDEVRFLRKEFNDLKDYQLRDGDLLFTRYNGSLDLVGACAVVRNIKGVIIHPDKLIRARFFKNTVLPDYLELYFATYTPRRIIEDKAKSSAGQTGISGKDLKDVPIILPPKEEQMRIVARIKTMFAQADLIQNSVQTARHRLDTLAQASIERAFRGEL